MTNRTKTAFIILLWAAAIIAAAFLSSCKTTQTERFHGDKDSVSYYRNGNIEWQWRNR